MKKGKTPSRRQEFHQFELAWIVRNYLKEHNFDETLEKFTKEAGEALKHPKGKEVAPQDVKSLRQVLEDYVAVKVALEDRNRDFTVAQEKTQTLIRSFNTAISEFYTAAPSQPNWAPPVMPRIFRAEQPIPREGGEAAVPDFPPIRTVKRKRKESSSHTKDSGGKASCPQTPPQIPSVPEQNPVRQDEEDRPCSLNQGEGCESLSSPSSANSSSSERSRGTDASRPLDCGSPLILLSDLDDIVLNSSVDKIIANFCPPELSEIDEILGQGLDSEELMNFALS